MSDAMSGRERLSRVVRVAIPFALEVEVQELRPGWFVATTESLGTPLEVGATTRAGALARLEGRVERSLAALVTERTALAPAG